MGGGTLLKVSRLIRGMVGLLKVSRLEARGGGTLKGVPIRG